MGDLISRRSAIEALKNQMSDCNDLYNIPVRRSIVILEQLPSAQPDLDEWCTDCKEYDKEKHSCPRFNRVIREALKDAQPEKGYTKADYIMALHKEYGCDIRSAEKAHDMALEYLRSLSKMKG